jgi:hypothetical protein
MLGSRHPGARRRCRKTGAAVVTPLLPLVGLIAFITTVMIEAMYFVCHLWRCLFDGSALSFSWTEPLPVAGLSTVAVLLGAILAARFMSLASEDSLEPFTVKQTADNNARQANLSRVKLAINGTGIRSNHFWVPYIERYQR